MTPELLRVVGRYEILRLLGRGGMASVHLARQPALDREVALKELHPVHAKDPAFAHRFLNESRVAGALNHPSVVSVIEYFEHEGVPFIAMEYLERGSLRPLVGQLTLAQVAGVLDSVLAGLAEAAAQGIVHRDLKPENVLVTADGHAKVADFGIAKAVGQVCMTDFRTATGQIVGTPAYMAPEQITGGEISPQVDLYATGLLAYELLAGRHPFDGTDAPMALLMRHLNDSPPSLASVRPDLPPGVVAWVHGMLAKEPALRPAGAASAWDRLEGVVSDTLGPRWRRDATITGPAVDPAAKTEIEPVLPSDRSGIYSVVLPPIPMPVPDTWSAAVQAESEHSHPALASPARSASEHSQPVLASPVHTASEHTHSALGSPVHAAPPHSHSVLGAPARSAPAHSHPVLGSPVHPPPPGPPRRLPRRLVLLALAGVLILAIAAILYSTAPGEEPRAAQRPPAGPSVELQLREAVTPAVRAGSRVSTELSSLLPGASPDDALDRVGAALAGTGRARTAVGGLRANTADERLLQARAGRALSTQADYLGAVRTTLRLEPGDDRLGSLAARLVSRLERIETAVPAASASVGGVGRLQRWLDAEIAADPRPPAVASPVPVAAPTVEPSVAPTRAATPAPTATATPEPTVAPPVSGGESGAEAAPPFHPRRARLKRRLQRLAHP